MVNSPMCAFSSFGGISSISLDSFLDVRNSLSKATFCWVFFLVFSFSWSSINRSTELMSANLEAMILGRQVTLQTFTLNYFAWPPRKAGKTDTIFPIAKKMVSGFWLIIRYFSPVRKVVWPIGLFSSKRNDFYAVNLHLVNLSTYIKIYLFFKFVLKFFFPRT